MNKEMIFNAFKNLPGNIKEAEIAEDCYRSYSFEVCAEEITNINYSLSEEYFIRVKSEKEGYYYTQDASEDPYEMFMKAYENSSVSEHSVSCFYNQNMHDCIGSQIELKLEDLKKDALNLYRKINSGIQEGNLSIEFIARKHICSVINNKGLDIESNFPEYILIAYLNGKDDEYPISIRSDLILKDPNEDLKALIEDLNERYGYEKKPLNDFENGEYRVLLHHNFVYVMMCTAWQLFSGKKYTEDATCFKELLNQRIGSECLNFVNDNQTGFSFPYDCEGSKTKVSDIVIDGIFKMPLMNIESSQQLNLENNGCAGRKPLLFGNIATDVLITPANFLLKKGDMTYEKMIEKLKNGLIITEHFDIFHSLDISSGDFSIPCYGVKVKDGKIEGNLRSLIISGNIRDLLNQVEAVSERGMVRPMHYLNNYGIGSSDMLITSLKVSGE